MKQEVRLERRSVCIIREKKKATLPDLQERGHLSAHHLNMNKQRGFLLTTPKPTKVLLHWSLDRNV